MGRWSTVGSGIAILLVAIGASAQVPQPFPRGDRTVQPAPPPAPPTPTAPTAPQTAIVPPPPDPDSPTEADLGMPLYPTARFLTSYDAGRGQRYYLFGATAPFEDLVDYYQAMLKERGHRVFDEPPTHVFEVGRFRESSMAFPPGVTVKDYTWGGSGGYLSPAHGTTPDRYPSVIQIVPAPTSPGQ